MDERRHKSRKEILDDVYGRAIARADESESKQIRSVQLSTVAREIPFAQLIGKPDYTVFENLALDIGFHHDTHPEGSIGIMNMSIPEAVIIGADLAVKSGSVDIGFMDRFSGTLIIFGPRSDVEQAMADILDFFSRELHFKVCDIAMR